MNIHDFKVNNYLTLRLEKGQTVIYTKGERFIQCKHLLFTDPQKKEGLFKIRSIDEAHNSLKKDKEYNALSQLKITPEQEFWGHCSNLQAWYEHDYNTTLLHSNLSFPLLKKLMELGDIMAKKVFKEEIACRLEENYAPINQLLIDEGYINYLSTEELEACCPKELKVEGLILASRNLVEIPPLIRKLPITGLKFLNLINNNFFDFPKFILRHEYLEVLLLKENQLKFLPESMTTLKMLKILDASENRLETLPYNIGSLKSLKTLNLYGNSLVSLPDSIGGLVSLKNLNLADNRLQELPESIGKLINLEQLSLRSNQLSGLPSTLNNLIKLKSLDLSDNKFQNSSTIEFVKTLNLKVARNNANSMIQNAEQFLSKNNSLTSEQKAKIFRNIKNLNKIMVSDDFEEIVSKTHDLSFY